MYHPYPEETRTCIVQRSKFGSQMLLEITRAYFNFIALRFMAPRRWKNGKSKNFGNPDTPSNNVPGMVHLLGDLRTMESQSVSNYRMKTITTPQDAQNSMPAGQNAVNPSIGVHSHKFPQTDRRAVFSRMAPVWRLKGLTFHAHEGIRLATCIVPRYPFLCRVLQTKYPSSTVAAMH